MSKKIFLTATFGVLLLLSLSTISYTVLSATYPTYAGTISCPKNNCNIGSCACTVSGCNKDGLVRIWDSNECKGVWDYEFPLDTGGYSTVLKIEKSGIFYGRVHNGDIYCTDCVTVEVRGSSSTTITTESTTMETTAITTDTTTTTTDTSDTIPPPSKSGSGDMTVTIFVILLIILIIGAVVYYFLIMKKKPAAKGKTYEDLYRKWPRR